MSSLLQTGSDMISAYADRCRPKSDFLSITLLAIVANVSPLFAVDSPISPQGPLTSRPTSTTTRQNATVIIQTPTGQGSGFAVMIDGQIYIVSNAHVLIGSDTIRILTADGANIPWRGVEYSTTEDLARCLVDWPSNRPSFLIDTNAASPNQEIIVCGNSLGSGVITELPGKVLGVGPHTIEVDAGFVQGNSGSPIVNRKNSAVVGVATYVVPPTVGLEWVARGTRFAVARRFGTKLEGVKWVKVDRKVLVQQMGIVRDIDTYATDYTRLLGYWLLFLASDEESSKNRLESEMFFNTYSAEKESVRYSNRWWPNQLQLFCDMYMLAKWDWKKAIQPSPAHKVNKNSFMYQDNESRHALFIKKYEANFRRLPVLPEGAINETKWCIGYLRQESLARLPLVELLKEMTSKVETNCGGVPGLPTTINRNGPSLRKLNMDLCVASNDSQKP